MGRRPTKLDDAAVLEIVQAPRTLASYAALAEKFGVSWHYVRTVPSSRRGMRIAWRASHTAELSS